jgi:spermidine synthase
MPSIRTLFLIIFLEGYAVLSLELLSIRQSINFIGSNTDKIAIIIAAVLIPLAAGYFSGGRYKARRDEDGKLITIRKKLLTNIEISAILMTFGLSFVSLTVFFTTMIAIFGIRSSMMLAIVYAAVFVFTPCYFLAQTVPLVSNFFPKFRQSEITGKMLFISTLGSFMGSVFCTLVLMKYLGVNFAAPVTLATLLALTLLIGKKPLGRATLTTAACLIISILINLPATLARLDVVEQNPHNTLAIKTPDEETRILVINNTLSSKISTGAEKKFRYIEYAEEHYVNPIATQGPPLDILVIGAGGFTLGLEDAKNKYTYVDIDPSMKRIAEEKLLQRKILPNKAFVPMPARAFLTANDQKYDLIFMDIAFGMFTVPEQLLTREYFTQIKGALKEDGRFVMNFLGSPNFGNAMAASVDNSIRSVFPFVNRQVMYDYNAWERRRLMEMNITYSTFNRPRLEGKILSEAAP